MPNRLTAGRAAGLIAAASILVSALLATLGACGEPADTPGADDAAAEDHPTDAGRSARPKRDASDPDGEDIPSLDDAGLDGGCPDPGTPTIAGPLEAPTPPYAATFGPTSRSSFHGGGDGNPAGSRCVNCHNPGGAGRPFLFAGTVRQRDAAAEPTPWQVVVREAFGRVLTSSADQDGNFFFDLASAPACASLPLRAAVRDATSSRAMPEPQRSGNCNGCHSTVAPP